MEQLKNKILEFFKGLDLNEELHKYTLNGYTFDISVSGLIKPYYYPTDWDKVKESTAINKGVSIEEIELEWKKASDLGCSIGDKTHKFGEDYVNSGFKLEPETGHEKAVVKFWNDLPSHIVPLTLEVKMHHKNYLFAGTADILLYNTKTKTIHIADYKTNKDLFKNYKEQKMLAPFENFLCCPFNHYKLQLSFYQILLEQIPGIKVASRKLIWLLPDGNYQMFELEDLTSILNNQLKITRKWIQ